MTAALRACLDQLPPLGGGATLEEEARAVLRPLVERALAMPHAETVLGSPETCPNCGQACGSLRTPYCSIECKEISGFVRRFRIALTSGAILDPAKQTFFGEVLWKLEVGGYPLRQPLVPPKVVAKVIERDGGVCSVCGSPASEVDHAFRADGGSG